MRHYVYGYRDARGVLRYVGRGAAIDRVESHIDGSHNVELDKLIASGKFAVEVAGPYDDAGTCAAVEAALISSHRVSLFNKVPGSGPGFAPLGVPVELSDRLTEPVLSLSEVGVMTGGCLLVRLSSGGAFKNAADRKKFDPASPDDAVVAENVVRYWQLAPLVAQWGDPASGRWPKVIAGLGGPPDRRYIVGALEVLPRAAWKVHPDGRYEAPVVSASVDSHRLRGRLVEGARFNNYSYGLYIWVDGAGTVRHLPKR